MFICEQDCKIQDACFFPYCCISLCSHPYSSQLYTTLVSYALVSYTHSTMCGCKINHLTHGTRCRVLDTWSCIFILINSCIMIYGYLCIFHIMMSSYLFVAYFSIITYQYLSVHVSTYQYFYYILILMHTFHREIAKDEAQVIEAKRFLNRMLIKMPKRGK